MAGKQKGSTWVYGKIPRGLAAAGEYVHERKRFTSVKRVNRNAVMAAVRDVQMAGIGTEFYSCDCAGALKHGRQGTEGLQTLKTALSIVAQRVHCGIKLVCYVGHVAVRVEDAMPGAGTRPGAVRGKRHEGCTRLVRQKAKTHQAIRA